MLTQHILVNLNVEKKNLTISSLHQITNALEINLADFFQLLKQIMILQKSFFID